MKKIIALLAAALLLGTGLLQAQEIYGFRVKNMEGKEVSLSRYKGKVLLIVNTATKCGFTPQYKELQDLYEQFGPKGLEILDFPCNQFGEQAPGSIEEIHEFCTGKYATTFPQFDKVNINGENADPLFLYLEAQQGFQGFGKGPMASLLHKMLKKKDADYASSPDIKWNFTKFLVDREGNVIARFEPTAEAEKLKAAIEAAL